MNATITEEHLPNTFDYADDDSIAAVASLPVSALAALKRASKLLSNDENPGINCQVAATHETIADFESARDSSWVDCKTTSAPDVGLPCRFFLWVQVRRGQARKDMAVIDCGEVRAVLSS